MELEHKFSVPVPVAQAWDVLLDVEHIAPCMPGATVESFDGETIHGRVKVKVGPIQVTYAGTAKLVERDEVGRRAVIDARAKESRGAGTANATIVAVLTDRSGDSTDVTVTTDLAITGKPAQFGRGVMVEVGNKILGKFADCLAEQLGSGDMAGATSTAVADPVPSESGGASHDPSTGLSADSFTGGETAAASGGHSGTTPAGNPAAGIPAQPSDTSRTSPLRRVPENEAIDLIGTAGLPVLKRLAPLVGGLLLLVVTWRLVVRPRR